jgi:hypothetical protein
MTAREGTPRRGEAGVRRGAGAARHAIAQGAKTRPALKSPWRNGIPPFT